MIVDSMRRLARALSRWTAAALLSACLTSGAARAAERGVAKVAVAIADDGLRATVTLDRLVTRFAFATADVVRKDEFDLLTPGLKLDEDAVTAERPFRAFELRIRPSTRERDAKYPAFYRVGEGGLLYAPALKGEEAQWRTRMEFRTPVGQVRYPSRGDTTQGYVFVGPRRLVREDKEVVAVADPATPPWLAAEVRQALAAAVRSYETSLGVKLGRKPLLIATYDGAPTNSYVGDVTPGGVVALRFHGTVWQPADRTAAKNVRTFILHEAFHFWNGGLASPAKGSSTWLHEGGAEYAALLASVGTGAMDEAGALGRLGEALNRCRSGLKAQGDKGMAQIGFLSNQIRYPCGTVLQWAADLQVRRESPGRTVMDVWADTVRTALRRKERTYGPTDFYSAARIDPGRFAPNLLLVETSGAERWASLATALNGLGAEIGYEVTANGRRMAMLFHLLGQACTKLPRGTGYGFYTDPARPGWMKLDAPEGCGILAGNPVLEGVEGGSPVEASAETYAAVQRKCAAGEAVSLKLDGGKAVSLPCRKALVPPSEDYVVRRRLPLPATSG